MADSYWHAKTALDLLAIEWDDGAHGDDTSEKFLQMARAALDEPGAQVVVKKGDADAALKGAAQVVEAVYDLPYLDHAPLRSRRIAWTFGWERRDQKKRCLMLRD